MIEQLLAAAGDGVRIQIEECGQDRVAAVAEFDGFQAGKQAPLLFVEQAVEQENGRFEFIGRDLEGGRVGDQRNGVWRCGGRGSDRSTVEPLRRCRGNAPPSRRGATTLAHQIVERIVDLDMEWVGEFVGEPAMWRRGIHASMVAMSVPWRENQTASWDHRPASSKRAIVRSV